MNLRMCTAGVPFLPRYDLLVAADGAGSAVREQLGAQLPGQFVFTQRMAPLVYKRFRQLPCPRDFTGGGEFSCGCAGGGSQASLIPTNA